MAKKQCSKGHIYDSAIYGDNCPFCPSPGTGTVMNGGGGAGNYSDTEVNQEGKTQLAGTPTGGPTISMGNGVQGGGTVIRPVGGGTGTPSGKKIAGLLVSYDTVSTGQVFNIYEGRNYIGRDVTVDISIQGDVQISGKHFSILYRPVDGKFKFKDEQSSNGTFVNEVLTDEGELNTFDVIRIGSTRLIFIAIPQLP
jgi:FHA domain.